MRLSRCADVEYTVCFSILLQLIAVGVYIFSLCSNSWFETQYWDFFDSQITSYEKLGLFKGIYEEKNGDIGRSWEYTLKIACLHKENICGYSCQSNKDDRIKEMHSRYYGQIYIPKCDPSIKDALISSKRNITTSSLSFKQNAENSSGFLNYGLWISSVIFLILGTLIECIVLILYIYVAIMEPTRKTFTFKEHLIVTSINFIGIFMILLGFILVNCQFLDYISYGTFVIDLSIEYWTTVGDPKRGVACWILLPALAFSCLTSVHFFKRMKDLYRQ